jgi:hypothetical protein
MQLNKFKYERKNPGFLTKLFISQFYQKIDV